MSGCPKKNGAYNLAEALCLKLYDHGWLMKAWLGCFLSARIRSSYVLIVGKKAPSSRYKKHWYSFT